MNAATPSQTTPSGGGHPPLSGFALIAVATSAALTTFIVVLDLTICNVSIPTIAAALGASPREGTWVITSYAVAEAATVLLSGWLSARFGTAKVLCACLIWFGIASALCGLAQNMDQLVIFRMIQGFGGGPLVPLAQTALITSFPKEKVPYAMAVWTVTSVLGPVTGPIIGGYICDNYHWSWIFLINVPLVFLGAFSMWRLLGRRDAPPQRRPVDFIGMVLMAATVGSFQFMLDHGQQESWFDSTFIVGLAIFAAIGFIAFLIWELTEAHPFVDLRVFNNISFTTAILAICFWFGPFFGSVIISPLWLQTNMHYTPTWAGIAGAPTGITMILLAPLVAWLTNRMDPRLLICAGFVIAANAFFWRGHFNSASTLELVFLAQIGIGAGMTCIFSPALTIATDTLKPHEMAGGTGLISFMRIISVAVATSVFVTYWQDAATRNRTGIVDRFNGPEAVEQVGSAGMPHAQALSQLDGLVQTQAVMMATNDTYLIFALLAIMGAAIIWLAPRPHGRGRKH
jgi:DHA2 family multidrug resistance protein